MRRNKGNIRQRSKDSFEIRYSLGKDLVTGKWKVKTTTVKGIKKDAEKELRRIFEAMDRNEYAEATKLNIGELLQQWLTTVRGQISPKTHDRYTEIVNHYLTPAFGATPLSKLQPINIQNAYNVWENSGRRDGKEGGLSPRSRLHIHRVLSCALKYAVRIQLLNRNPADSVNTPRVKKKPITTLSIDQATTLLTTFKQTHPRLYWPVLLALVTGMRRGEILALRWKNVDFEKRTVRVVESLEQVNQEIRFKAPKTERSRAVMLPEYAVDELKEWKLKQTAELAELKIYIDENGFVCGRWDGLPHKPESLSGEFARAIVTVKDVPRVRFHDLRHSHATQLLAEGIHPKIAQERLGHSSIKTTLDLYSHATDTMQSEAVEKLDTAFRSAIRTKAKRQVPGF